MPLVSVIIPVYNVEKYLHKCLDSVLAQTHANLQIICINDGSTDKSYGILQEYAQKDNRIELINQPNKGLSAARNAGMTRIKGKYCCFLDSDDAWHVDFVKTLLKFRDDTNADIVECDSVKHKLNDKCSSDENINLNLIKYKVTDTPLDEMIVKNKLKIRFMVWGKLYKTELIKNFNFIEGIFFEDYPWVVSLMTLNPKVCVIDCKLYYYAFNPSSITKNNFTIKKCQDYAKGLKFVYDFFKKHNQDLNFLRKKLIPNIFKTQIKLIKKLNYPDDFTQEFSKQLHWADECGLLSCCYHNLFRYYRYRKIMKRFS